MHLITVEKKKRIVVVVVVVVVSCAMIISCGTVVVWIRKDKIEIEMQRCEGEKNVADNGEKQRK